MLSVKVFGVANSGMSGGDRELMITVATQRTPSLLVKSQGRNAASM